MTITAAIRNKASENIIIVSTNDNARQINIPSMTGSKGSSVNGGELLFLALATCFCNDVYREAAKRNMEIIAVDCSVSGEFGNEGGPGSNITYRVNVVAPAHSLQEIADLISYVDQIAEIHNTIRKGTTVSLNV